MSSHIKNPLALYIGLRYSGAYGNNKFASFVSIMSMIGVCLGVAALIVVASVMNGLEDNMKGRVLSVIPHAIVTSDTGFITPDDSIVREIKQIPYVKSVSPVIDLNAIIQSQKKLSAVNLIAIDAADYPKGDLLASSLENGQLDSLAMTPYGIILGSRIAQELDLVPGEQVRIMFPLGARYTLTGKIPAQRLFTYVGSFYSGAEVDGTVGLINLDASRKIMRLGDKFTGYRVWLEDPFMIERFVGDYTAHKVTDWRKEKGPLFQAIAMEKKMMTLMLFLIVFVAVFNILSSLIMMVIDKTKEIAILRTMGLKSRTVMYVFMTEGLWCGLIGTVFGTLIGLICALYLNEILQFLGVAHMFLLGQKLPVLIEPLQIAAVILCSVMLTTIATIYPAYKAAQILPAEALRYE